MRKIFLILALLAGFLTPSQAFAQVCNFSGKLGYKVITLNGIDSAVWYPTSSSETTYWYNSWENFSSLLAENGEPVRDCGTLPLVIFSHGFGGCGTQSVFFTESLARRGYVVIAPDHRDSSACSVRKREGVASASTPDFQDRRDDIENVINGILVDENFGSLIDIDKIGLAGHSVGGYTALGMAGAWESWKDYRIKAILLFSPYVMPFSFSDRIKLVDIPVMYQGADFDIGITPFIEGSGGAYEQSNRPKYFLKIGWGNHFTWTNLQCSGINTTNDCLRYSLQVMLINEYGVAFLDKYLKEKDQPILSWQWFGVSRYSFER